MSLTNKTRFSSANFDNCCVARWRCHVEQNSNINLSANQSSAR